MNRKRRPPRDHVTRNRKRRLRRYGLAAERAVLRRSGNMLEKFDRLIVELEGLFDHLGIDPDAGGA